MAKSQGFFSLDVVPADEFSRALDLSPVSVIRPTVMSLINLMAYGLRAYYPKYLLKRMIVRNLKFVERRFSYIKANKNRLYARVRANPTARFSPWIQQERGGRRRERAPTIAARSGVKTRRMIGRSRLRSGKKILNQSMFRGVNPKHSVAKMLGFVRTHYGRRQTPVIATSPRRQTLSLPLPPPQRPAPQPQRCFQRLCL